MSIKIMNWAWQVRGLRPSEKLVLMKLADHSNDDGLCWPGKNSIARDCEVSKRTADAIITRLEATKLISIEARKINAGLNETNLYHLNFGQLALFEPGDSSGVQKLHPCNGSGNGVQKPANTGAESAPEPSLESKENRGAGGAAVPAKPKWIDKWSTIVAECSDRCILNIDYPLPEELLEALIADMKAKGEPAYPALAHRLHALVAASR